MPKPGKEGISAIASLVYKREVMTQIKMKPPTEKGKGAEPELLSVEKLTNAAWAFANSTFFKDCQLSPDVITFLREDLKATFQNTDLKEKAFMLYCKLCMIGSRHIDKSPAILERRGLWAISESKGLRRILRVLEPNHSVKARTVYLKSIAAVAESYLRFVTHPTPKVFSNCRDRILRIGNECLNQCFYNAVTFFKYL